MFEKLAAKDINLIIFGSLLVLGVIITGIVSSAQILKKEAIDNQLKISSLNGKYLAENLNQNMHNIEILIENISNIIDIKENEKLTNIRLHNILERFPIIRSINILDENKIIYSSNVLNLDLIINDNDFYPKALFSNDILRVSYPWIGRDFISGSNILLEEEIPSDNLSFIPILKNTYINHKKYKIIINLNSDFILSKFKERSVNNKFEITLSRTDNILLLSNKSINSVGKQQKMTPLLQKAFDLNISTGIEKINYNKKISTYTLTDDYPFIISLHLDYKESLLSWNQKSYKFFFISISIVVICIIIVLILILIYKKGKENEIQLHKRQLEDQEKFKRLFHDSHIMSAILSKEGKILDINNSSLEFLDASLSSVLNKSFWDLSCWQYDEQLSLRNFFLNNNSNSSIKKELKVLDKFKKQGIIEFSIFAINKDKDDYKYIAIAQDITQRKDREKKLLQAYTVFNNTRDGIIITDKDTNIIDVNSAFEQITGYSKKDILGKNIRILKSDVQDEDFYTNMWNSLVKYNYWEGEIINLKKDRSAYTEWLTINAILDKDTKVVSYIGIFSDISKEKEKEHLLKEQEAVIYQQSKMASMGEMIENIAHQWRQPLSVISTAATGIKMQKELNIISDEDEIKALVAINESAQYLSETIDDFKHFLKNDKELKEFSLESCFTSAIKLASSKLKNRDIQIIKDIEDIEIYGLKNEFIQVIINIINNARDALEESKIENKYIFINSKSTNKDVTVEIKNNGNQIPQEIINRIFEPYFTTKHQSQGTGIGLYMSSEIITNHMKGSFSVKNETFSYNDIEYKGPCFKIIIPI